MSKIIIQFDPTFFTKEIDDHVNTNILKTLSICLNDARRDVEIQRNIVLQGNVFASAERLAAVKFEIGRGEAYRFPQVAEGKVTIESFNEGLRSLGIATPDLQNFILLFILQNHGAFLNRAGAAVGQFLMDVDQNKNIYQTEADLEIAQNDLSAPPTTQIKIKVNIRQVNTVTTEIKNVGFATFAADINNSTLQVEYKPTTLVLEGDNVLNKNLVTTLTQMGIKKLTHANVTATKRQRLLIVEENEPAATNQVRPDFNILPLSRSEIISKNRDNISPETYAFQQLEHGGQTSVDIGVPGTLREKCIIQLGISQTFLNGIHRYLNDSKNVSPQDVALNNFLPSIIRLLGEMKDFVNTKNELTFHDHIHRIFNDVMRCLIDVKKICTENATQISLNGSQTITMLEQILSIVQPAEYFVYLSQNELQAHHQNLRYGFVMKHRLAEISVDEVPEKRPDLDIADPKLYMALEVRDLDNRVKHLLRPVSEGDSYKVNLRLQYALSWINYKKIHYYEEMQQLAKYIDKLESNKARVRNGSSNLNNAKARLELRKQLFDYYYETEQLLRKSLGKLNCYTYTAERRDRGGGSISSVHPRMLLAQNDPPHAPADYMEYLSWKTNQVFDGEYKTLSIFDYLNPFNSASYYKQVQANTKDLINETLSSTNLSPSDKLTRTKKIIEANKPSSWNFWSSAASSARDELVQLEHKAHLICLLDAFGRGYANEDQLCHSLTEYIQKNNVGNESNIQQFVTDLNKRYKENKNHQDSDVIQMLSQRVTSTAKACRFLINPKTRHLPHFMEDLYHPVSRVLNADKNINPPLDKNGRLKSLPLEPKAVVADEQLVDDLTKIQSRFSGFSR